MIAPRASDGFDTTGWATARSAVYRSDRSHYSPRTPLSRPPKPGPGDAPTFSIPATKDITLLRGPDARQRSRTRPSAAFRRVPHCCPARLRVTAAAAHVSKIHSLMETYNFQTSQFSVQVYQPSSRQNGDFLLLRSSNIIVAC